jgi:hypothetical protein
MTILNEYRDLPTVFDVVQQVKIDKENRICILTFRSGRIAVLHTTEASNPEPRSAARKRADGRRRKLKRAPS